MSAYVALETTDLLSLNSMSSSLSFVASVVAKEGVGIHVGPVSFPASLTTSASKGSALMAANFF
jgi:hypothetical protein